MFCYYHYYHNGNYDYDNNKYYHHYHHQLLELFVYLFIILPSFSLLYTVYSVCGKEVMLYKFSFIRKKTDISFLLIVMSAVNLGQV